MQLAELDHLYNELKAKEQPTSISTGTVVNALNESVALSIDKIVDNVEKAIEQAAKPTQENNADTHLSMGAVYTTALADAFANPCSEQQTKNLNRILFPVMLREGMKIEKNGVRIQNTPKDLLQLFKDTDSSKAKVKKYENCIFFSAAIPADYSITCGCLRLRDIPAVKLNCLRAYIRKTARGSKILLTCEEVPPFQPSIAVMRHYNRLEMKLVKTRTGEYKLVSWAVGLHPDRPFNDEMDRVCLLGKKAQ
jgi:hypothetical protein